MEDWMRFNPVLPLEVALGNRESHYVEFKASTGRWKDAAQAVVAFANANGGSVFIGVTPTGEMSDTVHVGEKTIPDLAADLDRVIYPYSPAVLDPVKHWNGKEAIRLSVVPDRPPTVGMYFYCSSSFEQDKPVAGDRLVGYRRVGNSNRKTPDFMLLREPQPLDPMILVAFSNLLEPNASGRVTTVIFNVWMPTSSVAPALRLAARVEPEMTEPTWLADDLPGANEQTTIPFEFSLPRLPEYGEPFTLCITYADLQGLEWETRLPLHREPKLGVVRDKLTRRIVRFPPKDRMP